MAGELVLVYVGGKKRYIPLPPATVDPAVVEAAVEDYLTANPPTSYTHPSTHPPSIIAETVDDRFVSDTEMNNKVDVETGKSLVFDTAIDDFHAPGSDKETTTSLIAINASLTYQTAPLDDDEFTFYKIVGTILTKVTWANIKSTLSAIYQATLVSGTNIKTINGTSVLGSGDMTVGGSSAVSWGKYF